MTNERNRRYLLMAAFVLLTLLLMLLFAASARGQEVKQETISTEQVKVKTWRIPADLLKNLNDMVTEFQKRFQETIEIYKAGLLATKPEFKDMPADVLLDLQNGVFIRKEDFERLQKEAQQRLNEQVKKDTEEKENVKKMD